MSTEVATQTRIRIKQPSMSRVVLLNDNYTPMDFVIRVLIELFGKTLEEAHALTVLIHERGRGVAGVYTREIAEQKNEDVQAVAKAHGHPLKSIVEEA